MFSYGVNKLFAKSRALGYRMYNYKYVVHRDPEIRTLHIYIQKQCMFVRNVVCWKNLYIL